MVDGSINMTMGTSEELVEEDSYVLLQAQRAQSWRFEGSWYDNATGTAFVASTSFEVRTGRLAFITLDGEGHRSTCRRFS